MRCALVFCDRELVWSKVARSIEAISFLVSKLRIIGVKVHNGIFLTNGTHKELLADWKWGKLYNFLELTICGKVTIMKRILHLYGTFKGKFPNNHSQRFKIVFQQITGLLLWASIGKRSQIWPLQLWYHFNFSWISQHEANIHFNKKLIKCI